MRLLIAVMLTFGVAALGSVGCGTKGKTTGPAGGGKTETGSGGAGADADKDFKFWAVEKDIKVKQGKDTKVTVKVERGKDFKEAITIDLKSETDKVKVDPAKVEIAAGKDEGTFTVSAEKDAKEGDFQIHAAASGGGKKHEADIKGKVEK